MRLLFLCEAGIAGSGHNTLLKNPFTKVSSAGKDQSPSPDILWHGMKGVTKLVHLGCKTW